MCCRFRTGWCASRTSSLRTRARLSARCLLLLLPPSCTPSPATPRTTVPSPIPGKAFNEVSARPASLNCNLQLQPSTVTLNCNPQRVELQPSEGCSTCNSQHHWRLPQLWLTEWGLRFTSRTQARITRTMGGDEKAPPPQHVAPVLITSTLSGDDFTQGLMRYSAPLAPVNAERRWAQAESPARRLQLPCTDCTDYRIPCFSIVSVWWPSLEKPCLGERWVSRLPYL